MKKHCFLLVLLALSCLMLAACDKKEATPTPSPTAAPAELQLVEIPADFTGISTSPSNFDRETSSDGANATIKLTGTSAEISGSGASFAGGKLSITVPGVYVISGTLNDGSVYVSIDKQEKVRIVLNGVSISCSNGPAIYIEDADKTVITLAEGTENALFDGKVYTSGNACIYSKDDLTINGNGSLTVTASYNNGIGCKNDLKIVGGNIDITATTNGLKGNDSVSIYSGSITINASKDGIKADTEDDPAKGFVFIQGGTLDITAKDDGIQAVTSIGLIGGKVKIRANDGSLNCKPYTYTTPGVLQ